MNRRLLAVYFGMVSVMLSTMIIVGWREIWKFLSDDMRGGA